MSETFETSRLLLRPRTLADTENCLAMDREPEVTRFVKGPWADPVAHRAFVEARTRGPWPSGHGYWTISPLTDPETFIGWVLLLPFESPRTEIGWRLRRQFWRQGIASEAAAHILRHAVVQLRLAEVVADIHPDNAGSMKVANRIGLHRVGPIDVDGDVAIRFALKSSDVRVRS